MMPSWFQYLVSNFFKNIGVYFWSEKYNKKIWFLYSIIYWIIFKYFYLFLADLYFKCHIIIEWIVFLQSIFSKLSYLIFLALAIYTEQYLKVVKVRVLLVLKYKCLSLHWKRTIEEGPVPFCEIFRLKELLAQVLICTCFLSKAGHAQNKYLVCTFLSHQRLILIASV